MMKTSSEPIISGCLALLNVPDHPADQTRPSLFMHFLQWRVHFAVMARDRGEFSLAEID